MKSVDHIEKLANRFARKLSLAQSQGAQAGDIEQALKSGNAWPQPNDIAPLLNAAKVPDDVSIDIKINVDAKLNVVFAVTATPANAAGPALQKLLQAKYAAHMSQVLKAAQLSVTGVVTVGLATFTAN